MSAVFVHVSDIHFGQEKDDRFHTHNDVKQQLINDARNVIADIPDGVVEGILVSGDIAHSGIWSEYEAAGTWLDKLALSIGVGIQRVQMVPGNHDLDRSRQSTSAKLLLDHIRQGGPEDYENVLKNPADRAALFSRFKDYSRFSLAYNCPLNDEGIYDAEMEVQLAPGRRIRFVRMNSSLLCHGEEKDEQPELMLGARQFTIPREEGIENIILVHHPLNWYKDRDQVKDYIRSRARVFISGHEHDPKVLLDPVEPGSDVLMLAAGATVPYHSDETYTFTYNILEFDWDEETDGLLVTIHPRAWNAHRTCFERDDKRLGGKDPKFCLQSPFFRQKPRPTRKGEALPTADGFIDISCFRQRTDCKLPVAPFSPACTLTAMVRGNEGYEIARLRFFRDLYEGERLRILIGLGALTDKFNDCLNQGLERRLFDMLVREGKLDLLKKAIAQCINERKDEETLWKI